LSSSADALVIILAAGHALTEAKDQPLPLCLQTFLTNCLGCFDGSDVC
jgi:hypothetical protein